MSLNLNNDFFISILICCYNSENFIEKTLNSLLSQKYFNYEVIIVDDGSTDKTKKIIENTLKSKKYIYHFQKNKGLAESRNIGIKLSKSNYVFIIDHDDLMTTNRLNNQIQDIKKNNDCAIYYGDCYIDRNTKITKFNLYKNKYNINLNKFNLKNQDISLLRNGCFIASSTIVINKIKCLNYTFDKNFSYVCDYDYFINVAKENKIYQSDCIYGYWTKNPNQISFNSKYSNYLELIKMYNKYLFSKSKYIFDLYILIKYLSIYLKLLYYKFR